MEGERLAVDHEVDVAQHIEVEPGGGGDDVGFQDRTGLQQQTLGNEAVDLIGDHGDLAGPQRLHHVAVGENGDALAPRAIGRREMLGDLIGADIGLDTGQQLLRHRLRLLETAAGEDVEVADHLAANDVVHDHGVEAQRLEHLVEGVRVGLGNVIGSCEAAAAR